jgi:hypothetical protein
MKKPQPEIIILSNGQMVMCSIELVVDSDGKVYDLDGLLRSIPLRQWDRWRVHPGDEPSLFAVLSRAIKNTDDSFTGLQ